MKLDKTNICVFIENEAQLQEARELLERYGETIDDEMFYIHGSEESLNYLQVVDNDYGWWLALNRKANGEILKLITLTELETILKDEHGNITSKEVSQQIYNDFDMIIYTDQDHYDQVKKCAIKHVEGILLALDWIEYHQTEFTDVFWNEVKQHLNEM